MWDSTVDVERVCIYILCNVFKVGVRFLMVGLYENVPPVCVTQCDMIKPHPRVCL